jgi:aromatic ring-opening dioxygenase catalytic subunit (LigB family)
MDEFQEILKLKNYRELRNILGIFREYINDEKILFVISGSFPHIMRDMIANGESPLYNQFKELKLDYFDKESFSHRNSISRRWYIQALWLFA